MFVLGFMYQQTGEAFKLYLKEHTKKTDAERLAVEDRKEKLEIAKAISLYNSGLNEESMISFAVRIREESKKYSIDWKLILAIIQAESEFNSRARSHKGAIGLMQVMPSTAKWVSSRLGVRYRGLDSLYDPDYNIRLGMHYLDMMRKKYSNIEEALVAYNRGPEGLNRYVESENDLPAGYIEKVMGYYRELKG
jgi:soluble lytic murein transglycosylase